MVPVRGEVIITFVRLPATDTIFLGGLFRTRQLIVAKPHDILWGLFLECWMVMCWTFERIEKKCLVGIIYDVPCRYPQRQVDKNYRIIFIQKLYSDFNFGGLRPHPRYKGTKATHNSESVRVKAKESFRSRKPQYNVLLLGLKTWKW